MSEQDTLKIYEEIDLTTKFARNNLLGIVLKYFLTGDTLVLDSPCEFHEILLDEEKIVVDKLLGLSRGKNNSDFYLDLVSKSGEQYQLDSVLLSFDEIYDLLGILLGNYNAHNK